MYLLFQPDRTKLLQAQSTIQTTTHDLAGLIQNQRANEEFLRKFTDPIGEFTETKIVNGVPMSVPLVNEKRRTAEEARSEMLCRITELTTRRDEAVEFIKGCKEEQKDFDRVEFDLAFGVER
jgi:uncharacterized protein YcaQ